MMKEPNATYQTRILDLIEVNGEQKVLVINNEDVAFIDELKRRNMMVEIFQDNKGEIQTQYDIIILFGLRRDEQGKSDIDDLMRVLISALNRQGQLLWCIDNKFGMKYWSGMQYEQGGFFRTLESINQDDLDVISYQEIINLLHKMPETNAMIYFPYPDYRYPMAIYSSEWLPHVGDLENYDFNFSRFRYRLFDESKVWNNIISEGLFMEFANSFVVRIERH